MYQAPSLVRMARFPGFLDKDTVETQKNERKFLVLWQNTLTFDSELVLCGHLTERILGIGTESCKEKNTPKQGTSLVVCV